MENKLDPNKTYRTRSGLKVRNVRRNETGNREKFPWCADVYDGSKWCFKSFKDNGKFLGECSHSYDLIEVQTAPFSIDSSISVWSLRHSSYSDDLYLE